MKLGGLIGFIFGGAAGFGVGYIVAKRQQIKKNDAELEAMRQYYEQKLASPRPKVEKPAQKASTSDEKPSEEALKLKAEKFTTFDRVTPLKAPITDYAAKYKITRKENDDPSEDLPEGDKPYLDGDIEDQMANEVKGMVIISDQEWEEDDQFDKKEITYFENDEIFADEYGRAIDYLTPDDFGRPNLEHFGITGEEGVLYCRDKDNMVDYRINLEDMPYDESFN